MEELLSTMTLGSIQDAVDILEEAEKSGKIESYEELKEYLIQHIIERLKAQQFIYEMSMKKKQK